MDSQEATRVSVLQRLVDSADVAAWERARREFVERYTPWIWHWLMRQGLQPADAEDVRQEALLKALMEIKGFEHNGRIGAFRAWLRWIVRHRLQAFLRERVKQATPAGSEIKSIADEGRSRVFEKELLREMLRDHFDSLQGFEPATLEVAKRVLFDGESIQRVAKDTGKTDVAVRVILHRVKRGLRESLEMSGDHAYHA